MLNSLPKSSEFEGDTKLFSFLSSSVENIYKLHFDVTSSIIEPSLTYSLPIKQQMVVNEDDSGIYGFFMNSSDKVEVGLGSAISC
jgi:hypothetical protein